ncbi:curli-like amyloid fiber formation chaperone CsgH [uncultured Agrobacterium sp.]|uniref:curli-like amyloid fiber formation chaperone CsgH n=1 Tax=uncultured Agrobacterium sp. TaxID=157277 RepID=UPI0025F8A996|nr:curli-like amyloid fiber formation chaperone CsgH [uncultured Agrobacterium sp.]
MYRGAVADERVAECGIIVSRDEIMRIEPFLVGRDDLEGRLVLNVQKKGATGTSRSSQTSMFANGTLGRIISSFEQSSAVTVEMIVTDRFGKALCELRRSIIFGSAATKI